jgi:hypothetical protein
MDTGTSARIIPGYVQLAPGPARVFSGPFFYTHTILNRVNSVVATCICVVFLAAWRPGNTAPRPGSADIEHDIADHGAALTELVRLGDVAQRQLACHGVDECVLFKRGRV